MCLHAQFELHIKLPHKGWLIAPGVRCAPWSPRGSPSGIDDRDRRLLVSRE